MNKNIKKILFYCEDKTDYYQSQFSSLKKELEKFDYDIQILFANNKKKYELLNSNNLDVIIDINSTRNNHCLNSKTKYISWIQDVFSREEFDNLKKMKSTDYVLSFGDLKNLGIDFPINCKKDYFYSGTNFIERKKNKLNKYDLNIVGFIPPFPEKSEIKFPYKDIKYLLAKLFTFKIFHQKRNEFVAMKFFRILSKVPIKIIGYLYTKNFYNIYNIIKSNYDELEGKLNINNLQHLVFSKFPIFKKIKFFYNNVNNIVRDYPRFLDRLFLIKKLQDTKYTLAIAGRNWEKYFKPKNNIYFFGEINPKDVASIYEQSKITISSNCHGLGLHSRILEAGICKSLIFMNKSDPNIPGNMAHEFIPNFHYIEYTQTDLKNKINKYLNNDNLRTEIINNMYKTIQENHLWSNRAYQLNQIISK